MQEITKKIRVQLYDEVIKQVTKGVMCKFQQQFDSYNIVIKYFLHQNLLCLHQVKLTTILS